MTTSAQPGVRAWLPIACDFVLAIAIAASAFGAMASSVPDRDAFLDFMALAAIRGSLAVFTAEFALRAWIAMQKGHGVAHIVSFAGAIDLPARGNWDADIVIVSEGRRFAVTRRLFLQ